MFRTPVKLGSVLVGTLLHTAQSEDVAFCYRTESDGFTIENDVKHFKTLKAFGHWFKAETGISLKRLREELVRTGHFY